MTQTGKKREKSMSWNKKDDPGISNGLECVTHTFSGRGDHTPTAGKCALIGPEALTYSVSPRCFPSRSRLTLLPFKAFTGTKAGLKLKRE